MSQTIRLPRAIQAEADLAAQIEAQPAPPVQVAPNDPPAPPPEPATPAAPPPDPPADLRAELARANQRAATAEGMLRSQGQELREARSDNTARFQKLEQQLAEMMDARSTQQQHTGESSVKDVEAFGADLVEMVRRQSDAIVREAVSNQLGTVLGRIQELEKNVNGVTQNVAVTAEQAFYRDLDRQVTDWREVNSDSRFHTWLAEMDPIYGVSRQAALINAQQALDSARIVAIFQAFKATLPAPAATPKQELQAQVAPARTGADSAPAQQAGVEYVRQSEIDNFNKLASRGLFRGTEAEMDALTAKYHRAILESRVIP